MKRYKVLYTRAAMKAFEKLDKSISSMIYAWVESNLEGCSDPRVHGKALSANRKGQWRYRIGDYRLIAELRDKELIILTLAVGHRSSIYN